MHRLWLLAAFLSNAAADPYTGPAACNACHPAQYRTQAPSRHARALRPIAETTLGALLSAQPLRERSGIAFEYRAVENGVSVTATQGQRAATAILQWAFGAGAQAMTPVGLHEGRFLEHRISWYTAEQGARRTLGHPGTPSSDPARALGIPQDAETIYRCFNCHATGVRPGPDLAAMRPGVTCERCHGAGGEHAAHSAAIRVARTRESVMELCGSCHRLPSTAGSRRPETDDPLSIRFAPVGLAASACYRKSSGLSCVTCHDPHADAAHEAAHYDAKCRSCHQGQQTCKTGATADCVRCHMRQSSPAPYLRFTDHRIRVYR